MAHWDRAQGQAKMAKITQKHPYLWHIPQKSQTENKKCFFSMSTRRHAESVEGLNSRLALAAGDL